MHTVPIGNTSYTEVRKLHRSYKESVFLMQEIIILSDVESAQVWT